MTTKKFTPGPWKARYKQFDKHAILSNSGQMYICEVSRYDTDEQCEANAKLITAAPDLFDALYNLVKATEDDRSYTADNSDPRTKAMREATKAILKAAS